MEKQPMLTPFIVDAIESYDTINIDPATGEEVEDEFHVVVMSCRTQRINSAGNLTTEYRQVRQIQNGADLATVKKDFPIGARLPKSDYVLVKHQRTKTRTWNYYDRDRKERTGKIDYDYEAVHPMLIEQQQKRQAELRSRLTQRETSEPLGEVGAPESHDTSEVEA